MRNVRENFVNGDTLNMKYVSGYIVIQHDVETTEVKNINEEFE